jgi:hypothetical protein
MPFILHGFKLTRGAHIGLDNPRVVTTFIETVLVQNDYFKSQTLSKTMEVINAEVRANIDHRLDITALDVETGVPADEFSDNLMFSVDMNVPSKRFH